MGYGNQELWENWFMKKNMKSKISWNVPLSSEIKQLLSITVLKKPSEDIRRTLIFFEESMK